MADTPEIVIKPPSKDKPGFLRRQRHWMGIQKRLDEVGGEEAFDEMLDYLLSEAEITAPDGVDLREALLDLSEAQYAEIFGALSGRSRAVDPQSDA